MRALQLSLGVGLLAALPFTARVRSQGTGGMAGCYELRTSPGSGDVVFVPSPDSVRLEERQSRSARDQFQVHYMGGRPRSQFNRAFRQEVRWQPQKPDSVVIYAPLGMWIEHLRFAVDTSGQVKGRILLHTDVVSAEDTAQQWKPLTGKRIPCSSR